MWVKPPKATQNEAKEAFATGGIPEPNKDVLTNPLVMRVKVPGNEVMQLQSRSFELTRILGFSDVKWNPKEFQWSPSWWFVATTPWNIKQVNSSKGDAKSWLRSEDGIEVVKLTLGKWKLLPPFLGGRPLLSYSYTNLFMELLLKIKLNSDRLSPQENIQSVYPECTWTHCDAFRFNRCFNHGLPQVSGFKEKPAPFREGNCQPSTLLRKWELLPNQLTQWPGCSFFSKFLSSKLCKFRWPYHLCLAWGVFCKLFRVFRSTFLGSD